jgi:NADH:ubiquinone oxidoreductase subunit K
MLERLAPLLISLLSLDFGAKVRRAKRNGVLYLLAGLLLLTAYGFALAGLAMLLGNAYGGVAALFLVALGALALALAVLTALLIVDRKDRKRAKASPASGPLLAIAAASLLPIILRSRVMTSTVTLGVIALVASWIGSQGNDHTPPPA